MKTTLAFDIYGTLIDVHGLTQLLATRLGEGAAAFSSRWREKQLEYSFRRGLMRNYVDFATCTAHALEWTDRTLGTSLDAAFKKQLIAGYATLPAFAEASTAVTEASSRGYRLFAFTNGTLSAMGPLLERAGLRPAFLDVVSTDELKTFKPDPAAYAHFLRRADAVGTHTWLVSSNPFDVTGALSAGLHAAWICRDPRVVFDPWEIQPTVTVSSLCDLVSSIEDAHTRLA